MASIKVDIDQHANRRKSPIKVDWQKMARQKMARQKSTIQNILNKIEQLYIHCIEQTEQTNLINRPLIKIDRSKSANSPKLNLRTRSSRLYQPKSNQSHIIVGHLQFSSDQMSDGDLSQSPEIVTFPSYSCVLQLQCYVSSGIDTRELFHIFFNFFSTDSTFIFHWLSDVKGKNSVWRSPNFNHLWI